MRNLSLLLLSAVTLQAQYASLATNYTGDFVYFSGTQTLRGESTINQPKLYALQQNRLTN